MDAAATLFIGGASEKHLEVYFMANRNTKAYDIIADRIISALDKGEVPWRKPWSLQPGMKPQSVAGRPYHGINAVVLGRGLCVGSHLWALLVL